MMEIMPSWAEIQSKQKGFVGCVVGEVQDENIIFLTGLWDTEEDFRAAFPTLGGFLAKIDFGSLQDGPTRSGAGHRSDSPLTVIKVGPVTGTRA